MRAGTHVGDVVAGDRRVMDRPQDRIAVVGLVDEVVLRQADMQRQRRQHARTQLIQLLVQLVAALAETSHFAGPQVRRHHCAVRRIVRNLAADVPELLEIEVLGILGGFHAERGVAARAAAAFHVITALGRFRQREERLEHFVGGVDVGLGDAVIADAGKAPLPISRSELGDEGLAIGVETGDVQRGDARAHTDVCSQGRKGREKPAGQISRRYNR